MEDSKLVTIDEIVLNKKPNEVQIIYDKIENVYSKSDNPFKWLTESVEILKEKNFFETRVTEYQTGGKLKF